MPKEIFNELKKVWVVGQQLNISRLGSASSRSKPGRPADNKSKTGKKRKTARKKTSKKKVRKRKTPQTQI